MNHSRSAFLGGAAAAFGSIGIVRSAARAADFTFKVGLDQPATHPTGAAAVEAADRIQRESGGRIAMQVFLDNALGNDTSMLTQVRSGAIAFFICPATILANVVPVAAMESVAFAFKTIPQARRWTARSAPTFAPASSAPAWTCSTARGAAVSIRSSTRCGRW